MEMRYQLRHSPKFNYRLLFEPIDNLPQVGMKTKLGVSYSSVTRVIRLTRPKSHLRTAKWDFRRIRGDIWVWGTWPVGRLSGKSPIWLFWWDSRG